MSGLRQRLALSWSLGLAGAALLAFALVPSRLVTGLLAGVSWLDLTLVVVAVACLAAAFIGRPVTRYSSAFPPGARLLRVVSAWWVIAGLAAVLIVMWATTGWLLGEAGRIQDPAAQGLARIEAVRTGMSAAAGLSGRLPAGGDVTRRATACLTSGAGRPRPRR